MECPPAPSFKWDDRRGPALGCGDGLREPQEAYPQRCSSGTWKSFATAPLGERLMGCNTVPCPTVCWMTAAGACAACPTEEER